jgi:serine/threonine protein kinase
MEFLPGKPLNEIVEKVYNGKNWAGLDLPDKEFLITIILQVIDSITTLHRHGYCHRDITPFNFLLGKKGKLYMIDLELMYSIEQKYPNPAFGKGTPGYVSPEQAGYATPTIKEDIYGLGGLMFYIFCCKHPPEFDLNNANAILDELKKHLSEELLIELTSVCCQLRPWQRPDVAEISALLKAYLSNLRRKNDLL